MTVIHLVRHGETDNPDRILYLRMPGIALSTEGHRQARCVARMLRHQPISAVISSPIPRAVQTADYIAFAHGLTLDCSALLNEIHSPYQGYAMETIEQMQWDLYSSLAPEYEQWGDILGRVQRFCRETCAAHPGQHVAAVTHGDIVVTATLWARGLPLTLAARESIAYPGPASITTLTFGRGDGPPGHTYLDPFARAVHPTNQQTKVSDNL